MTMLPNPFDDNERSVPAVADVNGLSASSTEMPSTGGADAEFMPDFALLERCLVDWPDDPPPLFIGAPSDDFIAACHRNLLPLLEDLARRG